MNRRIRKVDIILTTKKIALLLEANIDIINSLKILIKEESNKNVLRILENILDEVSKGSYLSDALKLYPKYFNSLYINILKIGESSGEIYRALNMIYEYEKKKYEFNKEIKNALAYPIFLIISTIIVMTFIFSNIYPVFNDLYRMYDIKTPIGINLIFYLYKTIKLSFIILVLSILILLILGKINKTHLINYGDYFLARIPVLREIKDYIFIIQFSTLLNLLLEANIAITDSIDLIKNTFYTYRIKEKFELISIDISKGMLLSDSLLNRSLMRSSFVNFVSLGENTGEMSEALVLIRDYYTSKLNILLDKISNLLEPILILIIGLIIGFILINIISPVFNIMPIIN